MDRRHRAVRHVAGVHEVGAGDVQDAPGVTVRLADGGVAGVDDGDAVDVQCVAVGAGVDGGEGELPHAVLALGQGARLAGVAGEVGAGKLDRLGLGGVDGDDDGAVVFNFG